MLDTKGVLQAVAALAVFKGPGRTVKEVRTGLEVLDAVKLNDEVHRQFRVDGAVNVRVKGEEIDGLAFGEGVTFFKGNVLAFERLADTLFALGGRAAATPTTSLDRSNFEVLALAEFFHSNKRGEHQFDVNFSALLNIHSLLSRQILLSSFRPE